MVYDTGTHLTTEIAPCGFPQRYGPVLGGNQIAFTVLGSGNGDIMVFDLSTNGPLFNVSISGDIDSSPSLTPASDAVAWHRCVGSNCGILRSVKSGAGWGAGESIVDTPFNEENPDTDGVNVVYDADRGTGPDIYFQPLSGGTETQLPLAGQQVNPCISRGVIAFESRATDGDPADIYVYVMATNTLLQVTNSPTVDDTLNDVTVACCQIPFQVNSGYLLLPLRVSSN